MRNRAKSIQWRKNPSVIREGKWFYTWNGFTVLQDFTTQLWRVCRDNAPCALGKNFVTAEAAMRAVESAEMVFNNS